MAECNVSEMISDAYCLTCTIPREMWPAVKLSLLCSIATSGGGGTGGAGVAGHGSPEGVVVAAVATSYFDLDTNSFWYKASGAGNSGWQQLIA